jgi:cell division septal protein FtsQ
MAYSHAKPRTRKKLFRRAVLLAAIFTFITYQVGGWVSDKLDLASIVGHMRWFQIKEVTIGTEWPVTDEQIRKWIPPLVGKSILFINPSRIVELLEEKPWVASVILKKEFPDRVRVEVTTKRAVALLHSNDHLSWLDTQGNVIERATPALLRSLELPIVSLDKKSRWDPALVIRILTTISDALSPRYKISQLAPGTFPFFRVYLNDPRTEIQFSAETWDAALPNLELLLRSNNSPIGQLQRINLVFPKKAVVSSPLSH